MQGQNQVMANPSAAPQAGQLLMTTPGTVQNGQVVMSTSQPANRKPQKRLLRSLVGMGSVQIVLGAIAVFGNIGGNIQDVEYLYAIPGYYCGAFYIVSGIIGIVAGKKRTKGFILTFMILSIIAPFLTVGIFITTALALDGGSYSGCIWDYSDYYDDDHYNGNYQREPYLDCSRHPARVAWNSLILIAGILEFVIAIVSACLCCCVMCRRPSSSQHIGQVQVLNGQQQLVLLGSPQFAGQPMVVGQPLQYAVQQPMPFPQQVFVGGQPIATGQMMIQTPTGLQPLQTTQQGTPGALSAPQPSPPPMYSGPQEEKSPTGPEDMNNVP